VAVDFLKENGEVERARALGAWLETLEVPAF
jgi:hypothetical protein